MSRRSHRARSEARPAAPGAAPLGPRHRGRGFRLAVGAVLVGLLVVCVGLQAREFSLQTNVSRANAVAAATEQVLVLHRHPPDEAGTDEAGTDGAGTDGVGTDAGAGDTGTGGQDEIVAQNADGSGERVVYRAPRIQSFATDGTAVLIVTVHGRGLTAASVVPAAGGTPHPVRLPTEGWVGSIALQKGRLALVFSPEGGGRGDQVLVADGVDGTGPVAPAPMRDPTSDGAPLTSSTVVLSPDGDRLIARRTDRRLVALPLGSGQPAPLPAADEIEGFDATGRMLIQTGGTGHSLVDLDSGIESALDTTGPTGVERGARLERLRAMPGGGAALFSGADDQHPSDLAYALGTTSSLRLRASSRTEERILEVCPSSTGHLVAVVVAPADATPDGAPSLAQPVGVRTIVYPADQSVPVASLDGFSPSWCAGSTQIDNEYQ